ncbi:MAG: hypothetical protein AB8B63_18695 [Granulosicoccus sp.]
MQSKRKTYLVLILAGQLLLSACSDTGSGAGDTQVSAETLALIRSFTGIYDLPDNWSGSPPPDEAFLQIGTPDDQGIAVASLYDMDDIANCIPADPTQEGEVKKDPFGIDDRVFLDGILEFQEAELELQDMTLLISFVDVNDLDGDNNVDESITLRAPAVGVSGIDELSPGRC